MLDAINIGNWLALFAAVGFAWQGLSNSREAQRNIDHADELLASIHAQVFAAHLIGNVDHLSRLTRQHPVECICGEHRFVFTCRADIEAAIVKLTATPLTRS